MFRGFGAEAFHDASPHAFVALFNSIVRGSVQNSIALEGPTQVTFKRSYARIRRKPLGRGGAFIRSRLRLQAFAAPYTTCRPSRASAPNASVLDRSEAFKGSNV